MTRTEIRERDGEYGEREFCRLEIELRDRDGGPELSICGSAGYVYTERQARSQAREFWISYFEECPSYIEEMNKRCGTNFRSPKSAAKYVLDCDGEYHGLDIVEERDGNVYVSHSCGQIRDELAQFFPELVPFFGWHLNNLNAACEHQDARGETYEQNPGSECLNCGWKLGHGWHKRTLPPEVASWAKTGQGTCPAPALPALEGEIYLVSGFRRLLGAEGNSTKFELRGNAAGVEQAKELAHVTLREKFEHIHIYQVRKDGDAALSARAIAGLALQQAASFFEGKPFTAGDSDA
jgi:hypothetical protein